MTYAVSNYLGSAIPANNQASFTFKYLDVSEIRVDITVSGTTTTYTTSSNPAGFSIISPNQYITLTNHPADSDTIRIYRNTDLVNQKATFVAGSAISANDLNNNNQQVLQASQESRLEAETATTTAETATTTANAATTTANQASTDANTAVTTANQASTDAANAVTTANTASTNATNAVSTANQASTDATSAVTTANTASTNASSAVTTANQAATDAANALSTANTASTAASNAVNTADAASLAASGAVTNSTNAVNTANAASTAAQTAETNATSAVNTANTASTAASGAVTTANAASTAASGAVTTANAAATDASTAVSTANTAATDASSAVSTANTASSNASTALTTVNNADFYTVVADVTTLLGLSPNNGNRFEVVDSTGAESQSSITGLPANFTGASSINLRVEYNNPNFEFLHYFAQDPDSRYVSTTGNAASATKLFTARNINGTSFDGTSNIVIGNVPQNTQSANYTLVASDAGHHVNITSGDVTVPQGVFTVGDVISIYNGSATTSDILAATGVDLYFAGTSLTGTRTLQYRGIATILCVGTDDFVVCGVGIS